MCLSKAKLLSDIEDIMRWVETFKNKCKTLMQVFKVDFDLIYYV